LLGYLGRDVADTRAMAAQVSGAPREVLTVVAGRLALTNAMRGSGTDLPVAVLPVLGSGSSGMGALHSDSGGQDVKLLWAARGAIGGGNAEEALRLLEKHTREYGASTHSNERETLIKVAMALREKLAKEAEAKVAKEKTK